MIQSLTGRLRMRLKIEIRHPWSQRTRQENSGIQPQISRRSHKFKKKHQPSTRRQNFNLGQIESICRRLIERYLKH